MKMNDEFILKYIAGLLTDEEQKLFESKLEKDTKLNERFLLVSEKLRTLKADSILDFEESYFNSILPKVRRKLEVPGFKDLLTGKLAFAFGFVVIILLFVIFRSSDNVVTNNARMEKPGLKYALNEISEQELNMFMMEREIINGQSYSEYDSTIIQEYFQIGTDESEFLYAILNDEFVVENLMNYYDDEQINEIYNSLLNEKIL